MGYNIGLRLIDEFLAKSGVNACQDFRDTCDVIAKVTGKRASDCRAVVFVRITETWGDLLLLCFFYWLVGVFASGLPYDCVLHDVHFIGCPFPALKRWPRQVGLRMFLGVSGEVVMWNKAPTPGVDEKAKPSWTDGFGNRK